MANVKQMKSPAGLVPIFYEVGIYCRVSTLNTKQIISAGNQISGLMRKDDNTAILIQTIFVELKKEGIETELIQLQDMSISPCRITQGK